MKKIVLYIAALGLMAVSCTKMDFQESGAPAPDSIEIPSAAYDGELLIKFAPEMTPILDQAQLADGPATKSGIPSTDEVLSILGAYSFERIFPVDPKNEERTRQAGLHLWYTVKFDEGTDLKEAVERLSKLGEISTVQCNAEIHRSYRTDMPSYVVEGPVAAAASPSFNDPYLKYQWNYCNRGNLEFQQDWAKTKAGSDVGCEEAWKLCTGNPEIIVAVLDEGVMYNHPDLAANMWVNEGEEFFAGKDSDQNGYADDKYGYNFVTDNGIISVDGSGNVGHGTHVAGTIAAVNDNGIGVSGIAGGSKGKPGVKIMSCQLFDGNRGASKAASAKAIKYAADNGAVILQCSWGYLSSESDPMFYPYPGPDNEKQWSAMAPLEKDAIDYFVKNAGGPNKTIDGGLAIFASGNEYACYSSFPAAYSKCLSVASLAADYTPATYTNYGPEVDFAAPGGDHDYYVAPGSERVDAGMIDENPQMHGAILSTMISDAVPVYGYMEGTSMACPHVSGVAALGLSYALECHRHFTADEFIQLMRDSASDLDQYYYNKEKRYHYQAFTQGGKMTKMVLKNYVGKMGRLPDAGKLLKAIQDGAGADMKLPNIYVAPDMQTEVRLDRYFKPGATKFTCSGADASVAKAEIEGQLLIVTGVKAGATSLTVEAGGESQTVSITVREGASDNGWL